jgi:hypothetical protein
MHTWIPQTIFTKVACAIRDIGLLCITSNVPGTWWFTRKEKEHPAFAWQLVSPRLALFVKWLATRGRRSHKQTQGIKMAEDAVVSELFSSKNPINREKYSEFSRIEAGSSAVNGL